MAQPQGDLQLRIGYWIVSHKQTLRTWWAISLLSIMFLSVVWTVLFFVVYFSQERKLNSQLLGVAQGLSGWRVQAAQPVALTAGDVTVIPRDPTSIDLLTELTNPNTDWGASSISAHFVVNGTSLPTQRLFLNPSTHRPVLQLNAKVTSSQNVQAQLVVDDTAWTRAASAALPAPVFTIDQPVAEESTVTVGGQTQPSVTVRATLRNSSVYSFYRVSVPVIVTSGTRVVGVSEVVINRWDTFTEKPLSVTFGYPVSGVTAIRIEPQASRFDASNTYR